MTNWISDKDLLTAVALAAKDDLVDLITMFSECTSLTAEAYLPEIVEIVLRALTKVQDSRRSPESPR